VRTHCRTLAAVLSTLALSGCDWAFPTGCAGVGYSAVRVTIRDQEGNPLALGSLVTLYDGDYREQDSSIYDPLSVYGAGERGGRTYDIQVSRRYYHDSWVRGVRAPGGGCVTGHEGTPVTITVPVVLVPRPDAPAVRAAHVLPPHILLDRPPYTGTVTFESFVDAGSGISRAVHWRITGDTGSVAFDPSTGTLRYRCLAKSGYITVIAQSQVDSTVIGMADVSVQGHPASQTDPPCS
jgi:hypothetical protein